ncbi:hypothetical protein K488DRAFT_80712 [Vararia minispora EC-137]|uniref:Uncharacterized protein n=1 Tax=Vararia minispora EC-137 TaxID=1314806 RepID=A0ACB8Q9A6_9AGAM|nr:hypothetical protein K488DRAFT_80712 [Vararia minispora EC-137]
MKSLNPTKEGLIAVKYDEETFQTSYKVLRDLESTRRPPHFLGNERSTHLKEKPPTFWTIDLSVCELLNVISYLDVEDSFDSLGHSWGGCLASEFEVRTGKKPACLHHLSKATGELLQGFPGEIGEGMAAGTKEPPKFIALRTFHAAHVCGLKPISEGITYSIRSSVQTAIGWSIIDRLYEIRVPSLVLNGANERAKDYVVAPFGPFFESIPKAK